MNKKYYLILAFVIVAIIQIFIPAQMVWNQEDIIATGKEFKFKTQPIDPNDPFRGKYVQLYYDNEFFINPDTNIKWERNEKVYLTIEVNEEGFAEIKSASKAAPINNKDYFMANIGYINNYSKDSTINVNFPFENFYMEETKAEKAEDIYTKSIIDTNITCYSLVKIKKGEAVLTDVIIGDKSIKEIVKSIGK
jgi:uncharacterized membrane-anchored protein